MLWLLSHPLDDKHGTSPEAIGPADIVVETRAKNCSKPLQSLKELKWEVFVSKHNFKFNLQEHFVCFYEGIIDCHPKFYYLYFPLALIN